MTLLALGDPRWLEFVQSRPDASLFHHPAWAGLLADCYGYPAMVVATTRSDGTVTAGLPVLDVTRPFGRRRWVSLPFTDHCRPLDGPSRDLLAVLRDVARSSRVEQVEVHAPFAPDAGIHRDALFVRHELTLSADSDSIWKRLRQNHRRSVNDARKAGLRVEVGTTATDIETFYRLHLQTRRRLGVPIQPRRFFRLLHERIIQPGLGFVLTAYHGDTPAAASVIGAWNGILVSKFSARADRFPRSDGAHLLYWTATQWGCENGFHTFDLGRSNVEHASLRHFKVGWGAREELLPYSWIGSAPERSASRRSEHALGAVIRNSSPWMCRAVGEIFYRYAT